MKQKIDFLKNSNILDPSVKRGFLHEPFGPKGITKKPRRTQRVRLRFFATFCLQSIRTEIPRLTDGSRIKSPLSVKGIDTDISTDEIISFVRESRKT